jgi:hypothetical protein
MTSNGLKLGHKMAEMAGDHAGEAWKNIAYNAFVDYAKKNSKFTTEDVRKANPQLPSPPDGRAWGVIPRRGVKDGIVTCLGWTRAKDLTVHGRAVSLWESNICEFGGEFNPPSQPPTPMP